MIPTAAVALSIHRKTGDVRDLFVVSNGSIAACTGTSSSKLRLSNIATINAGA
jgi:hypothetical protein